MNTTANFQVFPTPFAFSKKKHQQKKYVSQNMQQLLNSDKLVPTDKLLLDRIKKYLIQNVLNITIDGEFPYSEIDLKDFFKHMIKNSNNGLIKTAAVRQYVQGQFDV